MTVDVSGFGVKVVLVASNTFPVGITLTQFSDDADAIDVPAVEVGGAAKGLNGDLIVWSIANPTVLTINVIPGSEDDKNLAALLAANYPMRGKGPGKDIINITVIWPNGDIDNHAGGIITNGMPGRSVASAGRKKTRAYTFAFEGTIST